MLHLMKICDLDELWIHQVVPVIEKITRDAKCTGSEGCRRAIRLSSRHRTLDVEERQALTEAYSRELRCKF